MTGDEYDRHDTNIQNTDCCKNNFFSKNSHVAATCRVSQVRCVFNIDAISVMFWT
jgi:hypothetical protein